MFLKQTFRLSLLFLLLLFSPLGICEEPLRMVLIYPGGEGSQEDAQPILDRFFEQVQKNGGPKILGKYYPDLKEGLAALKKSPHLGILSLETYLTQQNKLTMEVLLSTIPRASKTPTDRYFFLATKDMADKLKDSKVDVYVSRPLPQTFFHSTLSIKIPDTENTTFHLNFASNLLSVLKKIGGGELKAAALVDTFEYNSLKKLKLDWAKNLRVVSSSSSIPSSPVVAFSSLSESTKEKLIDAFLKMANSEEGREILKTMRLNGFKKPRPGAYESVSASFAKAARAAPNTPASSDN